MDASDPVVAPARPLWLLSVVVILGLLGLGLGVATLLDRTPAERGPEVTFARDMMAHHAQAVEMAIILRDRIEDEDMRYFLLDMALTQQGQIGQMQGWLASWGHSITGDEPVMGGMGEAMGLATPQQVDLLRTLPVAEAEALFFQLMIRHHQGGVMMAEQVVPRTTRPEVLRLANAIIASQESEIRYMESLLTARGAPLPEPLAPMDQHGH